MEAFANIAIGMSVALSMQGLAWCMAGVALGTVVGVLPGVGVMATIAILMPLTFHIEPVFALIMLAGIYYGAAFGGSTASILLNLPGTANTAITCLDGYPMTQQGRAGVALFMTAIASFVGSILGLTILSVGAPALSRVASSFGSPEYFALMLMGLLTASMLASGSATKALASVALGVLLGLVGTDVNTGVQRFTLGIPELYGGIPLVAISLGLFGLPEIIANAGRIRGSLAPTSIRFRQMLPTRGDWARSWAPMLRGTGVGAFFGALPGTGSLIASFVAYTVEKRIHRTPAIFGTGAIEGITAPESANNAATQTAFIPTLTMGVPGDAVMALMLGALLVHGIAPGPGLIGDRPDLFWGLVVSFLVGNVLLLVLNIPLIGLWVRLLRIPYSLLFPAIVVFICLGVFSVNYAIEDLFVVMAFGIIGYVMLRLRMEPAPLILGFVLGPMMEENFRRAMQISRGDPTIFLTRPLSALFLAGCAVVIVWGAIGLVRARQRANRTQATGR